MKIVFSIILVMILFGCKSEKIEENNYFLDKYLPKLEEYILNDDRLSSRDKNTFFIEFNDYKNK